MQYFSKIIDSSSLVNDMKSPMNETMIYAFSIWRLVAHLGLTQVDNGSKDNCLVLMVINESGD